MKLAHSIAIALADFADKMRNEEKQKAAFFQTQGDDIVSWDNTLTPEQLAIAQSFLGPDLDQPYERPKAAEEFDND